MTLVSVLFTTVCPLFAAGLLGGGLPELGAGRCGQGQAGGPGQRLVNARRSSVNMR